MRREPLPVFSLLRLPSCTTSLSPSPLATKAEERWCTAEDPCIIWGRFSFTPPALRVTERWQGRRAHSLTQASPWQDLSDDTVIVGEPNEEGLTHGSLNPGKRVGVSHPLQGTPKWWGWRNFPPALLLHSLLGAHQEGLVPHHCAFCITLFHLTMSRAGKELSYNFKWPKYNLSQLGNPIHLWCIRADETVMYVKHSSFRIAFKFALTQPATGFHSDVCIIRAKNTSNLPIYICI